MQYRLLILLSSSPALLQAEEKLDNQIDQACMRHAVTLVARIKAEVIDNINEQQSKQMLAMAKESCEAYYTHTFANTDTLNAQPQDDEEKSNWLTEIILRGETERTAGHDRLKRMK